MKRTRTLKPQRARAAKRSTMPRRRVATAGASTLLANELRQSLGETHLVGILKAIRDEVRPALRVRGDESKQLAKLRAQNAARVEAKRAAIFADAVNSDEAGTLIFRTRPIVVKLAKAGELLAVPNGRSLRFPRWQFDERSEDGLVAGFRRVLSVMDASPFRKAAWLVSPHPRFNGRAPIELLRAGQCDRVYEEAKTVTSG